MNERIGTFCERCREVVCRCAEHEANLKRIMEEPSSTPSPASSFGDWVSHWLGDKGLEIKQPNPAGPIGEIPPEFNSLSDEFHQTIKEPYGWCIEWNFSSSYFNKEGNQVWTGHNQWSLYWKHKVYPTKEVCLLALKAIKANNDSNQYVNIKYRIFPVYQGKIEEV